MNQIRRAVADDAPALAELAERTFRDAFARENRAEDMDLHCKAHYGPRIQAAEIRDANRTTVVCPFEDRLIGYGQLRWGAAPACVAGARPAEIQRLYVDAGWHGKGVAQALMGSLLQAAIAGRADVAWLGVWERNPRARSFYAKSGFSVVGEHVFVVGTDPQRDLVLAKALDPSGVVQSPADAMLGRAIAETLGAPVSERIGRFTRLVQEIERFMADRPSERAWTCRVFTGTDGAAIFRGGIGHSLVIDPAGRLWRARSYEDFQTTYRFLEGACEIDTLTPLYAQMREYVPRSGARER
jgi:ribosomal protein S18 acetylase RimI-like enzyme